MLRRFSFSASQIRSRKGGALVQRSTLKNNSRLSKSVNLFHMMHPMHQMKLPPLRYRERAQHWMI